MAGLCASVIIGSVGMAGAEPMEKPPQNEVKKGLSTADHKKFQALQQDFQSGPEVTKACLTCHTEAASQMHKSIHWTWQWEKAKGMGKKNAINNF
jgi:hypothetical protein